MSDRKMVENKTVKGTSKKEAYILGLRLVTPLSEKCPHPWNMRFWGFNFSKCLKCNEILL